jgi:hypothetical protein
MHESGNKHGCRWECHSSRAKPSPFLIYVLASSRTIIVMSHVSPKTYAVTMAGLTRVDAVLSREIIQKKSAAYVGPNSSEVCRVPRCCLAVASRTASLPVTKIESVFCTAPSTPNKYTSVMLVNCALWYKSRLIHDAFTNWALNPTANPRPIV